MSNVAVLYLARFAEGFRSFRAFANSYREHRSEYRHDLVVIAKGFDNEKDSLPTLQTVFDGLRRKIIILSDDIGFDIHAYTEAAAGLSNEAVCCINTVTTLRSDGLVAKACRSV
jgi:hypothetical protein